MISHHRNQAIILVEEEIRIVARIIGMGALLAVRGHADEAMSQVMQGGASER